MKHKIKKHFIQKNDKQNFWLLKKISIIWLFIFFSIIILFPRTKQVSKSEVIFVFNYQENVHWSASQWDYLFQTNTWINSLENIIDESWQQNYIIQNRDIINYSWNSDSWLNKFYSWAENIKLNISNFENKNITKIDSKELSKYLAKQLALQTKWSIYSQCITPWWETVKDKDFVLAYQQREDVPTICNIQKRICDNWVLGWSFSWQSCKEDVKYDYDTPDITSYNEKKIDPLIQPSEAINQWANFDNKWKINETLTQTTKRPNTKDLWWDIKTTEVKQTQTIKYDCQTPRWEKVKHWQFVKAYKTNFWFIDLSCEVEIRLCVNWILKWNYLNKTCTYKDMTSSDYILWNKDKNKPTFQDLINILLKK